MIFIISSRCVTVHVSHGMYCGFGTVQYWLGAWGKVGFS